MAFLVSDPWFESFLVALALILASGSRIVTLEGNPGVLDQDWLVAALKNSIAVVLLMLVFLGMPIVLEKANWSKDAERIFLGLLALLFISGAVLLIIFFRIDIPLFAVDFGWTWVQFLVTRLVFKAFTIICEHIFVRKSETEGYEKTIEERKPPRVFISDVANFQNFDCSH